jgi:hypothetical protein
MAGPVIGTLEMEHCSSREHYNAKSRRVCFGDFAVQVCAASLSEAKAPKNALKPRRPARWPTVIKPPDVNPIDAQKALRSSACVPYFNSSSETSKVVIQYRTSQSSEVPMRPLSCRPLFLRSSAMLALLLRREFVREGAEGGEEPRRRDRNSGAPSVALAF